MPFAPMKARALPPILWCCGAICSRGLLSYFQNHFGDAMTSIRAVALLGASLLLAPAVAQPAKDSPSAARMRADIAFLASDRLKGRETGTPEFDMAADYVAA